MLPILYLGSVDQKIHSGRISKFVGPTNLPTYFSSAVFLSPATHLTPTLVARLLLAGGAPPPWASFAGGTLP
jgi:hypothetical protein